MTATDSRPMSETGPSASVGISHVVLNVRELERSHNFWTRVMGWEMSGELEKNGIHMRFYRSSGEKHHDLALTQVWSPEEAPDVIEFDMNPHRVGVNHLAIEYDRESWLRHIRHLQEIGEKFIYRADHGMAHSVYLSDPDGNGIEILYDVPSEYWEEDVDAALNHVVFHPTEGKPAISDDLEPARFGVKGA